MKNPPRRLLWSWDNRSTAASDASLLDLSYRDLLELPTDLLAAQDILRLNLSNNRLSTAGDGNPMFDGVRELNISRNAIGSISALGGLLRNVESLDLSNNLITEITADDVAALRNIRHLILSGNPLERIDSTFGSLINLEELTIERAQTRYERDAVSTGARRERVARAGGTPELFAEVNLLGLLHLRSLRLINLGLNSLSSLPGTLETLDLPGNAFTSHVLAKCRYEQLLELDLRRNRVTTVEFLKPAKHLRWLDLSSNPGIDLSDLASLSSLRILRLADCELDITSRSPMWSLHRLQELDLSGVRIAGPLPSGKSTNFLKRLYIRSCHFDKVDLVDLANFERLTELALVGSLPGKMPSLDRLQLLEMSTDVVVEGVYQQPNLKRLAVRNRSESHPLLPRGISRLRQLITLEIADSNCTDIIVEIGELVQLRQLTLTSCDIGTIPETMGRLVALQRLTLSGNEFTNIPEELFQFAPLQYVDLSNNHLTRLPASIGRLQQLEELELDSNLLTELPNELCDCKNLTRLSVVENRLVTLPEHLGRLQELREIDARNNEIDSIPASVQKIPDLTELVLNHNLLTSIPDGLRGSSVRNLYLGQNRLSEIPDWVSGLPRLEHLVLFNNKLKVVPEHLSRSLTLRHLYMQGCELTAIPVALARGWLTFLELERNEITRVPSELLTAPRLKTLRLESNLITELPAVLHGDCSLHELALSENRLQDLPLWLVSPSTPLLAVDVADNPLPGIPPEISSLGNYSILEYLRERSLGSSQQWVSKLLVVGEGGAGKTSLLRSLRSEPFRLDETTTHGINLEDLTLRHPSLEVDMQLRSWDFGGQEIYHASHQFFLTNRSLFVLVWNARLGFEQGRLYYWLNTIQALAPDSPIVIVATWTDERAADLPITEILSQYPQVRAHITLSNRTREGVSDLRQTLAEIASTLPLMGETWPNSWLAGAQMIRELREKCLSPDAISDRLVALGVSSGGANLLMRWLHDLGEILYFQDPPELADLVVLKPQWLSEYVSRVLDSPEVIATGGVFTYAEMVNVWSDLTEPMRQFFLQMMERFDLSYRTLEDRDVSLVVERLPLDSPHFVSTWEGALAAPGTAELRLHYMLNTLPAGVPTWLIARAHRFTTRTQWRNGALLVAPQPELELGGPRRYALIDALPQERILRLAVRGPNPQGFFSLLKDGVELILDRFPGLNIRRVIPCPGHDGEPCSHAFDYGHLILRYNRKRLTIECPASMEEVSVTSLLFGWDWSTSERVMERLDMLERSVESGDRIVLDEVRVLAELTQRHFSDSINSAQSDIESYCPNVFVLRPKSVTGWRRAVQDEGIVLQLYCQEPGAWHPTEAGGRYELENAAQWVKRVAPIIRGVSQALKFAAPVVGPMFGVIDEELYKEVLSNDIALMKELVAKLPELEAKESDLSTSDALDVIVPDTAVASAHGSALRAVFQVLNQEDPSQEWGGLRRVLTPEGRYLWLCETHAKQYVR